MVFTEGFCSPVLLTSVLVKGKQDPEVKGCGGDSSVNVHLRFYTNQVLTEIMLLFWAPCTDFPVNEFSGKKSHTNNGFQLNMGSEYEAIPAKADFTRVIVNTCE